MGACNYNPDATKDDGSCKPAKDGYDCNGKQLDAALKALRCSAALCNCLFGAGSETVAIPIGVPYFLNVFSAVFEIFGPWRGVIGKPILVLVNFG